MEASPPKVLLKFGAYHIYAVARCLSRLMVIPGSGTVSNSQCSVTGAGAAASESGNTLALTLPITFSPSFTGNQLFFLAARAIR
ncbi:MAG TPA: hypothetical protein VE959_37905 [Bryobacteraceae bacterium]|nr:hypothetical protein [Bryobacteraceae bacterium]